jgi:hypothetical protein
LIRAECDEPTPHRDQGHSHDQEHSIHPRNRCGNSCAEHYSGGAVTDGLVEQQSREERRAGARRLRRRSGWRGVYDELTQRGYRVTIVQNPLTSLADDVASTQRALERQDGPTILVGHSWGGTVITEAGAHPNVVGLVYVSALAPDAGESTAQQYQGFAATP